MEKKQARLRRARKTRAKIAELKVVRLAVHRSNLHISAQIFSGCGTRVLAAASTMEPDLRALDGDKTAKARRVGELVGERAKAAGITTVVFDRGGFKYHGRVAAVAEGAREAGLTL